MSDRPLPAPNSSLFPEAAERERIGRALHQQLEVARGRISSGRITPSVDMARFVAELEQMDFSSPQPLEPVLDWVLRQLEHGMVQMSNPRYYGLFNPAASFPAQCADQITSLFNPQLASSASSPVPVALEAFTMRLLAERAGFPSTAAGHFTTGGSEANFTALICALTQAHPDFARDGVRAFGAPVAFYTSRDCHIAWMKIAHQAGVGRAALQLVDTDGRGRMDARALAAMISADRASGTRPLMVVATAGTTGAGMIDPLGPCAQICAEEQLWLHVDAAWGGAALASERLRSLLAGIERADSLTIDAHKWLATTMGCGMFVTARPDVLSQAFHAAAVFMPSSLGNLDPYLNSVQWSRRFLGLRFFLSLRAAGWQGLAEHVERGVEVMASVRSALEALGWQALNDSPLAVLNVTPPKGSAPVRELVRRVVASGEAWAAPAQFEGQEVVRICATHGESKAEDVRALINALEKCRIP